jgi:chorismate mutase
MAPLSSIFSSTPDVLSLSYIRSILQRLEDTILFNLIERGQNARNAAMYQPGAFKELKVKEGWEKSWVEWFLKETESSHAKLRRWQAPDEYPFTALELLPEPLLPPIDYPEVLYASAIVNVNDQIYQHYRDELVPALTKKFGAVSEERQRECVCVCAVAC